LTNQYTNILGIYELPIRNMAFDTGIDKDMILKIFERFSTDKKVYYVNGWVVMRNFIKNQSTNSPMIIAGMKREFKEIPLEIKEKVEGIDRVYIEYVYDKLSIVKLSLSNINNNYSEDFEKLDDKDQRKELEKEIEKKGG